MLSSAIGKREKVRREEVHPIEFPIQEVVAVDKQKKKNRKRDLLPGALHALAASGKERKGELKKNASMRDLRPAGEKGWQGGGGGEKRGEEKKQFLHTSRGRKGEKEKVSHARLNRFEGKKGESVTFLFCNIYAKGMRKAGFPPVLLYAQRKKKTKKELEKGGGKEGKVIARSLPKRGGGKREKRSFSPGLVQVSRGGKGKNGGSVLILCPKQLEERTKGMESFELRMT